MISEHWRKTTAKQIGLRGDINFHTAKVGMTLHIPCEAGNHIVDVKVRKGLPPEAVAKHMVQSGWTIGSRLKCPQCKKSGAKKDGNMGRKQTIDPLIVEQIFDMKKTSGLSNAEIGARFGKDDKFVRNIIFRYKNNMPPETLPPESIVFHAKDKQHAKDMKRFIRAIDADAKVTLEPKPEPFTAKDIIPMHNSANVATSSLAIGQSQEETRRRLKRDIIAWLQESYDEQKSCYKSGFSDASIAKETGAAEKFVGEIREDLYGPMGEPDDLRQLRADFAAHMESGKAWLAEHDRVAKTFYARLERLVLKNGWKVEA